MTVYSELTSLEIGAVLALVRNCTYLSPMDGCYVVAVKCFRCEELFEDEVNAFIEGVAALRDPLCLKCDQEGVACRGRE